MPGTARVVIAMLLCACAAIGHAQVCQDELTSALPDGQLDRPATGLDAALLMHRAVSLVEPALPQLVRTEARVPADHPATRRVGDVAEWGLLPGSWSADELSVETWQQMNRGFLGWYREDGPLPADVGTVGELVEDMATTLDRVSRSIRPAALIASDPDDGDRLSFLAIIWNWTVYPRLLVFRPEPGVDLRSSPRDVLPQLSNCAVHVSAFITAPEDTAKSIFLAHNDSRMFVVATDPDTEALPLEVPAGEELEAFAFGMPELSRAHVYAAVFDGPEVGFGTLLGFLTRVRTNVSPVSIMSYMQTPQ